VGVACGEDYILQANLLKSDLCEQNNCSDELQIVFHAAPFFEERSLVQAEEVDLSQNNCFSFSHHLRVCQQYRKRSDSI
jgi:hypothetical protein